MKMRPFCSFSQVFICYPVFTLRFYSLYMQSPFRQILTSIREASITEKDKGTRFELLVKRYLETDPVYRDRFSQVWMWMDWPYRNGKIDQGIDLVAREAVSGEYCAIQCKCYDEITCWLCPMSAPFLRAFTCNGLQTWGGFHSPAA